tara:strand:+ start:157 stop:468 length:312 start_codon:yes stop_codon:yes gene_type:complete
MKKIIFILGFILFSFCSFGYTPINITQLEAGINTNVYPVVATTDNGMFQNYSIGADVHATEFMGSYSITQVVVNGQDVRFSSTLGSSNTYYFNYDGQTYYFTM